MEQLSRRALFGLGVGALALPVVRLLPDNVLPTGPMPLRLDKKGPGVWHLGKNLAGWEELNIKQLHIAIVKKKDGSGLTDHIEFHDLGAAERT